jgi:hypothetical protein
MQLKYHTECPKADAKRQARPQRAWRCRTLLLALCFGLTVPLPRAAAESKPIQHPNLLLNRAEIEQIKAKIKQQAWAAKLFDRVKALADQRGRTNHNPREAALVYVLTGERRYAQDVRQNLMGNCRHLLTKYEKLDLKSNPDFGAWGPYATWAWAYDLTYDVFSEAERQVVERLLRTAARTIIEGLKIRTTDPDLVFGKHFEVGIIGYCLGDKNLIEWALNDPGHHGPTYGGFYQVMDTNVRDRFFWGEAPRYALGRSLQGMLALAEAARHKGGPDLYSHVSKKSGASIKGLIDGYLRLGYPLERTGIGQGSLRLATFGDASTRYTAKGELFETFLINPVPGGPKLEVSMNGELELAYKRYMDPGYAWLLSLNPKRDAYVDISLTGNTNKVWGFIALTHGEPLPAKLKPPAAPGGVYPGQGVAVLRSGETSRYWTSGATAAVLRLGSAIGHGHKDYFHLILHGKGRLLYPDLELITYEPTYLNWTHEGIAHNTLLVDHQSPRPGRFTTRHDFTAEAKFFAITGSAFAGVQQTRALVLTSDYLADVFRAADTSGQARTFDYVLHGLGRLYPGNPAAYRPTSRLVPYYWWVDNEHGRQTDAAWQADWVQRSAGAVRGIQPLGKEWFEHTAGVRLTMLGAKGTHVYTGDGPLTDGPPYGRIDGNPEGSCPLVVARRLGVATTFAAVHEPYEKRPAVRRVRRIEETVEAVGLAVDGAGFSDRVLIAFDSDKERHLRSADGESFLFRGHGYVRVSTTGVMVRGAISAVRVRLPKGSKAEITVNGKPHQARREGDFLVFGRTPARAEGLSEREPPEETQAAVHYQFLPEEAHLKAGDRRQTTLHLRCVGRGTTRGRLRLVAPKGLTVQPAEINIAGMAEGEEKAERVTVTASADADAALYSIRIEPVDQAPAAAGTLPVSVGVVITEDKRLPLAAQFIVRAPGYTMKVDQLSGVSYSLLDGDGHRRHGSVVESPHHTPGIGAIERDGRWVFRYRQPCRFVWEGKDSLIVVGRDGEQQVRMRYTFHEDHITVALVPPTHPQRDYTLWLGEFDALGQPQYKGTSPQPNVKRPTITADWCFFPHPVHRQGILLMLPKKTSFHHAGTAVKLTLRAGQPVTLRFATPEQLAGLVKDKQ